jgi:hypothetical protein
MTISPIGIVAFTYYFVRGSVFSVIVSDVGRKTLTFRPPGFPPLLPPALTPPFLGKKPFFINPKAIFDLIFLGEKGKPGNEKGIVLITLKDLVNKIQDSGNYDGDKLSTSDGLIHSIRNIVCISSNPGSKDNFDLAVNMLIEIFEKGESKDIKRDRECALSTLEAIAIYALDNDLVEITDKVLEKSLLSSKNIFNIGLAALREKEYYLAVKALDKLESLVSRKAGNNPIPADDVATINLLGLIAHFYALKGAAKERGRISLENLNFDLPLVQCRSIAINYHSISNQYDTADALEKELPVIIL